MWSQLVLLWAPVVKNTQDGWKRQTSSGKKKKEKKGLIKLFANLDSQLLSNVDRLD